MRPPRAQTLMLVVVLVAVTVCASATVALVYGLTKGRIDQQERLTREAALRVAVPAAHPRGFEPIAAPKEAVEEGRSFVYYKAYDSPVEVEQKRLVGYAIEGRATGYSSVIRVIVGVDPSLETILGIKVTFQQETPGLGARCEEVEVEGTLWSALFGGGKKPSEPKEPWFQEQFRDQKVNDFVKKGRLYENIDTISGATITTNAVVKATLGAVEKLKKGGFHKDIDTTSGATVTTNDAVEATPDGVEKREKVVDGE